MCEDFSPFYFVNTLPVGIFTRINIITSSDKAMADSEKFSGPLDVVF